MSGGGGLKRAQGRSCPPKDGYATYSIIKSGWKLIALRFTHTYFLRHNDSKAKIKWRNFNMAPPRHAWPIGATLTPFGRCLPKTCPTWEVQVFMLKDVVETVQALVRFPFLCSNNPQVTNPTLISPYVWNYKLKVCDVAQHAWTTNRDSLHLFTSSKWGRTIVFHFVGGRHVKFSPITVPHVCHLRPFHPWG